MEFAPRFAPTSSRFASLLSWLPASPRASKKLRPQQQAEQHQQPSLLELIPADIVAECLSLLHVSDIAHVARTCKALNKITHQENVWRRLCQKYFPNMELPKSTTGSCKELFCKASELQWDKDFSTMTSQSNIPLLEISKKNRIAKARSFRHRTTTNFESAASRSKQSFQSGCHCFEFVIGNCNPQTRCAVGIIDASDPFNFDTAGYGDGENSRNLPSSILKQCFYWSDGSLSDITGRLELAGTMTLASIDEDTRYRTGDIIRMNLDMDSHHVTFYKNGKKVCTYSFDAPAVDAPKPTTISDDDDEEMAAIPEMHVGVCLLAEGDRVTVHCAAVDSY